jgi:enamine deaminase RidA (YjgF/YER057c/UK114 family)
MSGRTNFSSASVWEDVVGYSRAVKVGNVIEISGTVAADEDGNVIGRDDAFQQTIYILEKIGKVLEEAGASFDDVVRTRMFVTDITRFNDYARAHAEIFSSVKPCTSMIEVKALVSPDFLIEIEVTAIISQ